MESKSEVTLEDENRNNNTSEEAVKADGAPELTERTQGIDLSEAATKASDIVAVQEDSTPKQEVRNPKSSMSKDKATKERSNSKGTNSFLRNQRRTLSQSHSFPQRGSRSDVVRSTDGHPVRTVIKHAQTKDKKPELPSFDGSGKSSSHSRSHKQASAEVKVKGESRPGHKSSAKHNSTPSMHSGQQHPELEKSGSIKETTNDTPPQSSLSAGHNSEPVKSALSIKEDEDTHSSSSTRHGRRSSTSGFSFRLTERAERRKEFFTKFEERTHEKEAEKHNLLEKTKENQQAEIKQLRKSMTFKATPMPSFYKEPPPKTELKKIPTTRAISPKLGRHKSSDAATSSAEGSPRASHGRHMGIDHNKASKRFHGKANKDTDSAKKPYRRYQPRVQSHETKATSEGKGVKSKPKPSEAQSHNQETCSRETEESKTQKQSVNLSSVENSSQRDGVVDVSPTAVSHEVKVEG